MVQLQISEGPLASQPQEIRRFPFRIGRAPGADLRLEAAGVWDQHLELDFDPAQGFTLAALPPALATVNGWPIEAVILRNGDTIEIGSQKLRFWIGATKQSTLHIPESLVWIALVSVTAAQIGLILWLLR